MLLIISCEVKRNISKLLKTILKILLTKLEKRLYSSNKNDTKLLLYQEIKMSKKCSKNFRKINVIEVFRQIINKSNIFLDLVIF